MPVSKTGKPFKPLRSAPSPLERAGVRSNGSLKVKAIGI
jgi:hypothetical protein